MPVTVLQILIGSTQDIVRTAHLLKISRDKSDVLLRLFDCNSPKIFVARTLHKCQSTNKRMCAGRAGACGGAARCGASGCSALGAGARSGHREGVARVRASALHTLRPAGRAGAPERAAADSQAFLAGAPLSLSISMPPCEWR